MTNKIIITKTGYNAETETDSDNMVFNSDYGTLKYEITGSLSKSVTATGIQTVTGTTTFSHNLSYYPYYAAYVSDNNSTWYPNSFYSAGSGATLYIGTYMSSTTLTLYVRLDHFDPGSLSVTGYLKYFIFKNDIGF